MTRSRSTMYGMGRDDHNGGANNKNDDTKSNGGSMAWETTSLLPSYDDDAYDDDDYRGGGEVSMPGKRKRRRYQSVALVTAAVVVASMIVMMVAGMSSSNSNSNNNNIKSRTTFAETAPATLQSSSSSSLVIVEPPSPHALEASVSTSVSASALLSSGNVDSLMERWDEFKDNFARTVQASVVTSVSAPSAAAAAAADDNDDDDNDDNEQQVHQQVKDEHQHQREHDDVAQVPSETKQQEGRKFAAQVRQWWDHDEHDVAAAAEKGAAAVTAAAAAAAEHAIGTWWDTATTTTATALGRTREDVDTAADAVGTWWNATEHATERDAGAVEEAVETTGTSTTSTVRDKEQAVQRHFVTWWQTASADERAWWNRTVAAARNMERNAADREHVWWNEHNVRSAGGAGGVGEYWNRTEQAVSNDWDRTEQAVAAGWDRTEQAVAAGWDKSEQAVVAGWDNSEHAAAAGWDKSEHAVAAGWDNSEHAVAAGWDKTKDAAVDDWNRSKHAAGRTEHAVADDWDRTEHAVAHDWNKTKAKEAQWWNATERWFHSHLREVDPDADDEMRQPLLYLNSSTAYSLLMNGYGWYDYSADFFAMQSGFDAQINQAYCGVASSAAILNSLRSAAVNLTLPVDPRYKPYPYATQTNLLDHKCSRRHVIRHNATFDGVFHTPGGVSLLQIKALLQCYLPSDSWQVIATQVDPTIVSRDRFRKDITSALRDKHARVIINFNRAVLGQHGGGHFSPIASYSKEQDAFLIMDVAKYKYPPVWVSAGRLHAAASGTDGCGDWDFPAGQDRLSRQELLGFNGTMVDYNEGLRELNCTTTFRGYIIVRPS